jgi:hypothetical protein
MVPTVEFPPVMPLTCQVTDVVVVPLTVALNCCVPETGSVTEVGEMATATVDVGGVGEETAVPLSETVLALPTASLVMVRVALKLVTVVGEKVTCSVKLCPAGRVVAPLKPLTTKAELLAFTDCTVTVPFPPLRITTAWGALEVLTVCVPKLSELGLTDKRREPAKAGAVLASNNDMQAAM